MASDVVDIHSERPQTFSTEARVSYSVTQKINNKSYMLGREECRIGVGRAYWAMEALHSDAIRASMEIAAVVKPAV